MTNKELYRQAFAPLRISGDFTLDKANGKQTGTHRSFRRVALCIAACAALLCASAAAYSANVGGIQRTVQLWVRGNLTDAVFTYHEDGSYELEYSERETDARNRSGHVSLSGGGVAYDGFGNERPLTGEELLELLNDPQVHYHEDGSVWVCWFDQMLEITDRFDENGLCHILLNHGGKKLYMTVRYQDGWATSPNKYPYADDWNTKSAVAAP